MKRVNVKPDPKPTPSKMFGTNTAYNFRDKDPVCTLIRHACAPYTPQQVSEKSGVPVTTLWAICDGPTISPRYCTVARIVRGLGIIARIGEIPKGHR